MKAPDNGRRGGYLHQREEIPALIGDYLSHPPPNRPISQAELNPLIPSTRFISYTFLSRQQTKAIASCAFCRSKPTGQRILKARGSPQVDHDDPDEQFELPDAGRFKWRADYENPSPKGGRSSSTSEKEACCHQTRWLGAIGEWCRLETISSASSWIHPPTGHSQ